MNSFSIGFSVLPKYDQLLLQRLLIYGLYELSSKLYFKSFKIPTFERRGAVLPLRTKAKVVPVMVVNSNS